jgi:hypothetical protein
MWTSGVRFVAVALVASGLCLTRVDAQGGKVSGTFTVNGKKIPVQHVSAVTYDTPSQGRLLSVLVSDKPVDPKKFQEYTRIGPGEQYVPGLVTGAWVTMHDDDKSLSGFDFTFDAKGRLMLNDVLVGGRNNNFSILEDYLVLELSSVTPKLAGRLRTKEAVADLGSQKVGIDVTFEAPVVQVGK